MGGHCVKAFGLLALQFCTGGVRGVFIPMQHPWISAFIPVCFCIFVSNYFQGYRFVSFGFDIGFDTEEHGVDNADDSMDGSH
jgi:hypothetical protein